MPDPINEILAQALCRIVPPEGLPAEGKALGCIVTINGTAYRVSLTASPTADTDARKRASGPPTTQC